MQVAILLILFNLVVNAEAEDMNLPLGSNATFYLPLFDSSVCPDLSLSGPKFKKLLIVRGGVSEISAHVQARAILRHDSLSVQFTLTNVNYDDEGTYILEPKKDNYECMRTYALKIERDYAGTAYWLEWGPWSSCHNVTSCTRGLRHRTRMCSIPSRCFHARGDECESSVTICDFYAWSTWSPWSSCSVTCGSGRKRRQRVCSRSAADDSSLGMCTDGDASSEAPCMTTPCLATIETTRLVTWTAWDSWSTCSTTCGTGQRSRDRKCVDDYGVEASVGSCTGIHRQTNLCGDGVCEDKSTVGRQNTGLEITWTGWGAWSTCSVTCGSGWRTRDRKCVDMYDRDAVGYCIGNVTQKGTCDMMTCNDRSTVGRHNNRLETTWTDWGAWSTCSVTCGSGWRTRDRKCVDVYGRDAVGYCIGDVTHNNTCNMVACKDQHVTPAPSGSEITVSLPLWSIVGGAAGLFILILLVVIVVLVVRLRKRSRNPKPKSGAKAAEKRQQIVKFTPERKGRMKLFTRKKSDPRISRISELHVYAEINDDDVYGDKKDERQRNMSVITIDNPYAPYPKSASPGGGSATDKRFDFTTSGTYLNVPSETSEPSAVGDKTKRRQDSAGYLVPLQGAKTKVFTNQ